MSEVREVRLRPKSVHFLDVSISSSDGECSDVPERSLSPNVGLRKVSSYSSIQSAARRASNDGPRAMASLLLNGSMERASSTTSLIAERGENSLLKTLGLFRLQKCKLAVSGSLRNIGTSTLACSRPVVSLKNKVKTRYLKNLLEHLEDDRFLVI